MLRILRNKKVVRKIWIALAIIIIPAFTLWGLGGALRGKKESSSAGKIFGKEISGMEFQDTISAVKNQAIMQYGNKLEEVRKSIDFEEQAWERLMLLQEARNRKINVNDKEIIELIKSYPFFQSKGVFNERIYTELLRVPFQTQARIFEEQTRQNLMLAKLFKQVTKDVSLPDDETANEYRKLNEELSLYYIASFPTDFAKDIKPNEKEIKEYFDKNSIEFKQPLSFNLNYIILESEDKMKDAITRLKKKENLEKIALDLGLTIKETGLFAQTDPIPAIGWSPEVSNMISKLKVNELSPIIAVEKTYYVLKLKERKEPYVPEFEKIKNKIEERLIKITSEKTAQEKIQECLKYLEESRQQNPKSIDFDKAAKKYSLKSSFTENFKYGSYIEKIGASDNFWIAAKDIKNDGFSGIINMPSGFYIIKLKTRTPIDEKKFSTEKQEFKEKLSFQKKQDYFIKFIKDLKQTAFLAK